MAEFNMPGIAYSGDNGVMFSMRQEFDWRIDSVDSGCTGAEVSLVFDLLDLPRIAYCDDSSLNYAAYDGNQWIVTEIDSEGEFACSGITLELDDSDKPWIACRKNDDLCLYHHDGSVWSSEVLAREGAPRHHVQQWHSTKAVLFMLPTTLWTPIQVFTG